MGRGKSEVEGAENAPYDFIDAPGMVQIRTVDGVKSPVEVSAEILATLRYRAEDTLGDELVGAVITVPAYFDEAQRQATKDAARLAGLNVLRLLNEPTAAAIAYGLDNASEGLYAVYDLGGGTFDLSILQAHQGRVRSARGGRRLRARRRRFRSRAVSACARAGRASHTLAPEDVRLLLDRVRAAKEALSDHAEAPHRGHAVRPAGRSTSTVSRTRLRDAHRSAGRAHADADAQGVARREGRAGRHQGRGAGRRRDAHAGDPPRGRRRSSASRRSSISTRIRSSRSARRSRPICSPATVAATATTGCCST